MEDINSSTGTATLTTGHSALGALNTFNSFNSLTFTDTDAIPWNHTERIEVREVGESIEMIYKQTSSLYRTVGLHPYYDERLFKIVYSCVDGKWNKSEPIYGKIIPAQDESYEFED
jgi:hypothetical protein